MIGTKPLTKQKPPCFVIRSFLFLARRAVKCSHIEVLAEGSSSLSEEYKPLDTWNVEQVKCYSSSFLKRSSKQIGRESIIFRSCSVNSVL